MGFNPREKWKSLQGVDKIVHEKFSSQLADIKHYLSPRCRRKIYGDLDVVSFLDLLILEVGSSDRYTQ